MKPKKLIPLPKLLTKAQNVFNAWVRNRDKSLGCISCGGEVAHAGHYFSQGHHSSLRFDEMNVHGQCVACNLHRHGNLIEYRKGLVRRLGEAKVNWLEGIPKRPRKWQRFELEAIIQEYKLKTA